MYVSWSDFDAQQDGYAERAMTLFGTTGNGRESIMSMSRPCSVGSAQETRNPRALRPLGIATGGRPRTPSAIFEAPAAAVRQSGTRRPASR